jgi:hypothetical protein
MFFDPNKACSLQRRLLNPIWLFLIISVLSSKGLKAQTPMSLNELSAFQKPGPNWRQAGNVNADLNKDNVLIYFAGTGILVNTPDKKNKGINLISVMQHGDADVELDFMMAKGSGKV